MTQKPKCNSHSGYHHLSQTHALFLSLTRLLPLLPVSKGKGEIPVFTFTTGSRPIAYYAAQTYKTVTTLISQADERHSRSNNFIISALS